MIILLVEDSPPVVDIWKLFLRSVGQEFRIADTIKGALKEMQRRPFPDLVILDLRLKDSGPKDTLGYVPAFHRIYESVVVLIATGNPDESLPILAANHGADGFQRKLDIANPTSFIGAIRDAVRSSLAKPGVTAAESRILMLEKFANVGSQAA